MATYHHWLVLLETSLLVGLLPQTAQAQGEQHVNINFIVAQLYYVGGCTLQTTRSACSQKGRVWTMAQIRLVPIVTSSWVA